MTGTPTTEIAVATVPNAQKWACRGAKYESDNMPAAAMMIQSVIFSLEGRLLTIYRFSKGHSSIEAIMYICIRNYWI